MKKILFAILMLCSIHVYATIFYGSGSGSVSGPDFYCSYSYVYSGNWNDAGGYWEYFTASFSADCFFWLPANSDVEVELTPVYSGDRIVSFDVSSNDHRVTDMMNSEYWQQSLVSEFNSIDHP